MKQKKTFSFVCILACTLLTGCKNKNKDVWDDDATSGNYKGNSRSFFSSEDSSREDDFFGPNHDDFIGLKEEDLLTAAQDGAIPQPRFSPGEAGSRIPGIEGFHAPSGKELAIFKNVHFKTDDHILRDKESLGTIDRIVSYLKEHPDTYLFIEGHCDERAPEAYNLALGARRSNYIRSLLTQKGVDPERLHTVSYGKEKPLVTGHSEESWFKNRRGQFRLYDASARK